MNREEHLLVCLNEECTEIGKDADKALRFGLYDINFLNPSGPTNKERIVDELNDLHGVIELLIEEGMLPLNWLDPSKVRAKKEKVEACMLYAKETGALSDTASAKKPCFGSCQDLKNKFYGESKK